ncbi:38382_t:CDS:2 [Gigaspora margarita]|uniref:38382_t:CDS:1 n=1 Tax=Gigaspora margarita TaxID=4874 RepID=A0ABN7UIV0_GIGMA|nr:38382_t:CDS:2 [Gigaspora margarita]
MHIGSVPYNIEDLINTFANITCSNESMMTNIEDYDTKIRKEIMSTRLLAINLNDEELPDLKRFITYSGASYCPNSCNWTCGFYCDQIPDTTVIKAITTDPVNWIDILGAYATITRNSKFKEVVVTFRGTANVGNAVKDIEVTQCPYGFGSTTIPTSSQPGGVLVHLGFYTAFLTFQQQIRDVITESIKQYPDYNLVVTGHSLGGALASFAALDLKQSVEGANPYLYTYGEPRIGNSVFVSFMNKTLDTIKRVVNQADIVPHLPPKIDYEHHDGEIWIANTTANNAVKCSGDENGNIIDHIGPYWNIRMGGPCE